MCLKEYRIISRNLKEDGFSYEIIGMIGCWSLENFKNHLIRTESKDFNVEILDKFMNECEECNSK